MFSTDVEYSLRATYRNPSVVIYHNLVILEDITISLINGYKGIRGYASLNRTINPPVSVAAAIDNA